MNSANLKEGQTEFAELDEDEIIHVKKMPKIITNFDRTSPRTVSESKNVEGSDPEYGLSENITHQYLKFVNSHLAEKLNLVEKLTHIKNNLEREIELLRTDDLTEMITLPNISINKLKPNEINEVDTYMKLQQDLTKSKMSYYKNKLEEAETDMEKNLPDEGLNHEQLIKSNFSESDDIVKDELYFLIKKYGMKELTYAIDVITSSKMIRENRNLE